MSMDKSTQYGSINISNETIASVAINAAMQCYGVVDVVSRKYPLEEKKDVNKVIIKKSKSNVYQLDLFIIVAYGVRITEVVTEVQKKVKYDLECTLKTKFKAINVYVQGIKDI